MHAQPYGDRGWLITDMSDHERANCLDALEEALPAGCEEYVVGYDSVLLVGEPYVLKDAIAGLIDDSSGNGAGTSPRTIEIPVHYDGSDLKSVAETIGVPIDEVISRHSAPVYTVRMMGFSPGFPYLDGLHPSLVLERRASPRVRIEPGSVAIGGPHAGVYTVASPGGWHILGRTHAKLFQPDAAKGDRIVPSEVFALSVGDHVQFRPV
ncbi:MAG: 5-oxoprolinase subunit B family protein [Opitutales bacterium]|jgi:KipI family sensor histidine kinase inhibitor